MLQLFFNKLPGKLAERQLALRAAELFGKNRYQKIVQKTPTDIGDITMEVSYIPVDSTREAYEFGLVALVTKIEKTNSYSGKSTVEKHVRTSMKKVFPNNTNGILTEFDNIIDLLDRKGYIILQARGKSMAISKTDTWDSKMLLDRLKK